MAGHDVTPERALAVSAAAFEGPLTWGDGDCCVRFARAFGALWGVTFHVPTYSTAAGAMRWVARNGGTPEAILSAAGLVEREAHPGAAGILSLSDTAWGWTPAICIRPGGWAHHGHNALALSRGEARSIWGL